EPLLFSPGIHEVPKVNCTLSDNSGKMRTAIGAQFFGAVKEATVAFFGCAKQELPIKSTAQRHLNRIFTATFSFDVSAGHQQISVSPRALRVKRLQQVPRQSPTRHMR